jgi:hypothetical protein
LEHVRSDVVAEGCLAATLGAPTRTGQSRTLNSLSRRNQRNERTMDSKSVVGKPGIIVGEGGRYAVARAPSDVVVDKNRRFSASFHATKEELANSLGYTLIRPRRVKVPPPRQVARPTATKPRRRAPRRRTAGRSRAPDDEGEPEPPLGRYELTCACCGESFTSGRPHTRTCSARCRKRLHLDGRKTAAIPEWEPLAVDEVRGGRLAPEDGILWCVFPEAFVHRALVVAA